MTLEVISCPHCGFEFRQDLKILKNGGDISLVRGLFGSSKPKLNVEYIDLTCPDCKRRFEYEV